MVVDGKEMVEWMIENGYVVVSGIDKDGMPVYTFTQKAAEHFPDFIQAHLKEFGERIFKLWMKDAIEIYFDEDASPLVEITESSYALAEFEILNSDEHEMLLELIDMWERKGGE